MPDLVAPDEEELEELPDEESEEELEELPDEESDAESSLDLELLLDEEELDELLDAEAAAAAAASLLPFCRVAA